MVLMCRFSHFHFNTKSYKHAMDTLNKEQTNSAQGNMQKSDACSFMGLSSVNYCIGGACSLRSSSANSQCHSTR